MTTAPASRVCPECQGQQYLLDRKGDFAFATACSCSKDCRRCGGSGYVYVQREETFSAKVGARTYEALDLCSCRLLGRRIEAYSRARIPGVHARATLESYRGRSEAQEFAKQVATAFAHGYSSKKPSKGFVLSGPVGTGKTHLIAASLSHLILERGVRARYIEISLLYADIRRGFQEGKSGGEIIAPLSEVEVLAIDELGKGRGSQFEQDTLDELIARRYNAGRTTIFATNHSLQYEKRPTRAGYVSSEELKKLGRESETLRDRVGERIFSRLLEMCDFVEFPPDTLDNRKGLHEGVTGPKAAVLRGSRG